MGVTFRMAEPEDAGRVTAALAQLSADLGDRHQAADADILRAGFGGHPAFRAILAENGRETAGAALYSPVFSTVRGAAGVYVSDLWVAPQMRGQRLGSRLLAAVLGAAGAAWNARFLKLNVYHGSPGARRFYARLGFVPATQHTEMMLDEAGCTALKGEQ